MATFPMAIAAGETEVRRILREPVALTFTSTEIQNHLHRATRIASMMTCCNMVAEPVTLGASAFYKNMTGLFFKIESAIWDIDAAYSTPGPLGLERISLNAVGNVGSSTAGVPRFYSIWYGGTSNYVPTLFVWPIQAADATTIITTVAGYQLISAFANTMPYYLQYPCIYYALSCCAAKDGKHSLSALYMKKFLADCSFYRREIYDWRKQVDSKDKFKLPDITRIASTG